MTRIRILSIASLSAVALAAMGASAFSYSPTTAQARAEAMCEKHGVRPSSTAWELCLSHVTRAVEWGEFSLAGQLAHAASAADRDCLDRGLSPQSAAYRACIGQQIDAQGSLQVLGEDRFGTNVADAPASLVQQ